MKIKLTIRAAIEFALETEKLGAIFYDKLAQQFSDDAPISSVFHRLAREEEAHKANFDRLAELVPTDGSARVRDKRLAALQALSASMHFLHEDALCGALDEIKTSEDALHRAHEFERGTLAYYLELQSVLGRSRILEEVIDEEKRHIDVLTERLRLLHG